MCSSDLIIFIQISVMKSELQDLQPMLVSRSEETEALAKVIEAESKEVALVREVVEKDEAAANEAAMSSKNIKVCSDRLIYDKMRCYSALHTCPEAEASSSRTSPRLFYKCFKVATIYADI